jgi:TRAP transporter 4TM/12TM fusion protein
MRKLTGFWNIVIIIFSISLVVFHLYTAAFGAFPDLVQRSIHLGFVLTMTFLLAPQRKQRREENKVPFYDILLSILAVSSTIYLLANYKSLILEPLQWLSPIDIFFSVVTVLMILEASRRAVGLIFLGLVVLFFIYAIFGSYFPGIWRHQAFSLDYLFQTLYHSTNGIWGQMVGISAGMLAMFSLFSSILSTTTNGVETFIKLGQKVTGKTVGGQGKVALMASGLFGMISGSALANVAGTGILTIPLMKRSGYSNEWAAAVSAVGSTGGTIMPPMMGAGAFIMAQILGISYLQIAKASFLPALLYYAGAFVAVHYISKKDGLSGSYIEEKVNIPKMLVILVPIIIFLFFLFRGFTATLAAFYSTTGGFVISLFFLLRNKKYPKSAIAVVWKQFSGISISGAKSIVDMTTLLAGSQIAITLISLTGFDAKLSDLIIGIGWDQLVSCLFLSMMACIIFGMGLPSVASYVLASVIFSPALTRLGIEALAAHLFVFYFAGFSTITPPVCTAVSLSAKLAQANWLKTGFLSCLIALPAFIIPYSFVHDKALLFDDSGIDVIIAALTVFIGVYAVGVGVAGYFFKPLPILFRGIVILAGIMLVIPNTISGSIGLVVLIICFTHNLVFRQSVEKPIGNC